MLNITFTSPDRPLRRDAERNRRRILDAAGELLSERGLSVTLNDIAHHAGVGVGTVYRRFPDKNRLIEELFEERVANLVVLMERAAADPDPWSGLVRFLTQMVELSAGDRALKDLLTTMPNDVRQLSRVRDRLLPMAVELVERAKAAGQLRGDVAAEDLAVIQLMLAPLIDAAADVQPELWRRCLGLCIRGLATRPDDLPPLAPGPLTPEQVDQVMARGKRVVR